VRRIAPPPYMERTNTQALLWMRAMQKELRLVQQRLEVCMRAQLKGELTDEDFDAMVARAARMARRVLESAGDRAGGAS
jgi:hypothetical protein